MNHDTKHEQDFPASIFSTYDYSTLYISERRNQIKEKYTELIEHTLNREGSLYWRVLRNVLFHF